jgi:hypothetical protein
VHDVREVFECADTECATRAPTAERKPDFRPGVAFDLDESMVESVGNAISYVVAW